MVMLNVTVRASLVLFVEIFILVLPLLANRITYPKKCDFFHGY